MIAPYDYFANIDSINRKKYEALKSFFYDKKNAEDVAKQYGYSLSSFYSITRNFRKHLKENADEDLFFKEIKKGRKPTVNTEKLDSLIVALRKQNFSNEDIVAIVNSKGYNISYGYVYPLLKREGFAGLLRRGNTDKDKLRLPKTEAPIAETLVFEDEKFNTTSAGLLCFLPYIKQYGIDVLIKASLYPETKVINRMSSILSFLSLKLSNIRRYSADDLWCMDRGLGLFAGLNVLPKTAWLSSYSHRITRGMNISFLKGLHKIWKENNLLSDTVNLDFTTIPYWGEDEHLENNWSGKRGKALSSMLAVLAQDPDSGIIDYGDTNVMHKNESAVVLEYLDFYHSAPSKHNELKYLVFDSKFTNYENLSILDDKAIKFVTIRRRGKNIVEQIQQIEKGSWKRIRVEAAGLKKRTLKIYDSIIRLKGYCNKDDKHQKQIRQVAITGHGKIKPALILTNDFDIGTEQLVRKYSRRWLVEKSISEQIDFFHLNRLSSSMVIKVDFDLTMSILAHNLYRLFAQDLQRYKHLSDTRIYEKFIHNSGIITIEGNRINVALKKKRDLPQILEIMPKFETCQYDWLAEKKLLFNATSTS